MLDLSKPLGPFDGLTLYGDHEVAELVYYLPDRVRLLVDAAHPQLSLQIFLPDEAREGTQVDLTASVGALLSLGVGCDVAAERLERVRAGLSDLLHRDVRLTPPPWEDGRVDLLLLDSITSGKSPSDGMVASVVGSRRPSLQDGQLRGLFNARLDRRGAALVDSALRGGLGTLAGALYELEFAALRPALNLRISASLKRVCDYVRATLGVSVYYVGAEVGAAFDRMRDEGIIRVEATSLLDGPEAQRAADEAIKDFQGLVLRELFQPMVPPLAAAAAGGAAPQSSIVRVSAFWGHSQHEREISVDYSKRQATRHVHNPQSHLFPMLSGLDGADRFIQRVALSAAWREHSVEIAAPGAFADPLLQQVNVVAWRGREAVLPESASREGGLRMPANVSPLFDVSFTAAQPSLRRVAWATQPGEPPFYRYQVRTTWLREGDVSSPDTLWSEPQESTSQDLDLFPAIFAPTRRVEFLLPAASGALPAGLTQVEIDLAAVDGHGRTLATRTLSLSPGSTAGARSRGFGVRTGASASVALTARTTFHFQDARRLTLPVHQLLDREVTISSPFAATRIISLLVTGITPELRQIVVLLRYSDASSGYTHELPCVLEAPGFRAPDVNIPVLRADALVEWQAQAIWQDGVTPIGSGTTTGGTLILPAAGQARIVRISWIGPAPSEGGLLKLLLIIRACDEGGVELERRKQEYAGSRVPGERTVRFEAAGVLESSIERHFIDGTREREPFQPVAADAVLVTP